MTEIAITSNITADRIKKYLKEGKRFDGRIPEQFRNIEIEYNVSKKAEGSARVKLGNTEVIVGVKMDVTTPYPDSMDKGNLMTSAELLPLSSSRFESGPPAFESIELGRIIDRGLRESGFIDFTKLVIKEGEKVWGLFVDIYTINDDGNLIDAAAIGAVAALKSARLPKYDEETEKVVYGEFTNTKLPISKEPLISMSVYKIGDTFVVDPTREEEDIVEARVTIGRLGDTISSIQKSNDGSFSLEEINNVIDMAEKVSKDIFKKIEKQLE